MIAHRVRRLTVVRPHRTTARRVFIGFVFVALLGLGASVAYLLPSTSAAAAGSSSEGSSSAATTAATASTGSDGLLAGLLVGLFALLFVPFVIDVWQTHARKKEFLAAVKPKIDDLTEAELDDVAKQTTTGIEGLARTLMAFAVIGVFAVVLLYVVIKNVDIASDSVVGNAMAALITLLTAIVAFYFGTRSAQTSADAAASAVERAMTTPEPPPPPPQQPDPNQPDPATETEEETLETIRAHEEETLKMVRAKQEELKRRARAFKLEGRAPSPEEETTTEEETTPEEETPPNQ